jgi:hypothetical protein
MKKVIASLIIQRHVNNGTIKMMSGTRTLQESVRAAVNKVSGQSPTAQPPITPETTTPELIAPAPIIQEYIIPEPVESAKTSSKKKKKKKK